MADVIKMVRPAPKAGDGTKDAVGEAIYIGKSVDVDQLPRVVKAFEAFKKDGGAVPDVPFEMLTALDLTKDHWTAIAGKMTWTQTRMNLNTLQRKGVFEDEATVALVAERLRSPDAIRRACAFPYQLLAAFRAADTEMPRAIREALQDALEIATHGRPADASQVRSRTAETMSANQSTT
jgi:60 kDa SS-A/Ro ribonucleoprotein